MVVKSGIRALEPQRLVSINVECVLDDDRKVSSYYDMLLKRVRANSFTICITIEIVWFMACEFVSSIRK